MKQRAFIMLALLAGVLAGCKDFYPGVPEEYRDYFPYKVGDSIVFSNGEKEISFIVEWEYVEEEHYEPHRFIKIGWQPHMPEMAFGTKDTVPYISGTLCMTHSNEAQLSVRLIQDENEFGFEACTPPNELPTDITLYNPEKDSIFFKTVTIKKGAGITSFHDAQNDNIWKLKK